MQEKLLCQKISQEEEEEEIKFANENILRSEEKQPPKQNQNVPEYLIKELSNIVQKYQQYSTPQMDDINSPHYQDLYKNDPESFQTQYSIQQYPGNIKEAKQKSKNMTIKETYLHKKSESVDWLFVNIFQEKYILQKYGLGVPLLFTQIKMIIVVLYILFSLNLYSGFQQLGSCQSTVSCNADIVGGFGSIDIYKLPTIYLSSASFIVWIIFSFFMKIYIKRICEQEDEQQSQIINQGDQVILKYFQKGLDQQHIEQVLYEKLYDFCERKKIEFPQQIQIKVKSVTPIKNFYKINQQILKINKIYIKIIKQIIDNHIPILQFQKDNKFNESIFSSIQKDKIEYNDQKESDYSRSSSSKNPNLIAEQNQLPQIILNHNQKVLTSFQIETQQNSDTELQRQSAQSLNKQMKQINIYNEGSSEETSDTKKSTLKVPKIKSDIQFLKQQSINKEDMSIQNDSQNFNKQNELETINLLCQQYLNKNDRNARKMIRLLTKYNNQKVILQDLYQPNNTLTSSYILRCQNIQQKEALQYILKPSNQIVSFFQKCKYLFRRKKSTYTLNRIETSKFTDLNVNWNTIGIDYQSKIAKQFYIRILGTIQFLLSFFVITYIYSFKMDYELEESSFSVYFYKFLLAISQSLFYLVNEKIFELYSKHMVTSLKSKRVNLQISNFFFFYTLSYILFPLMTIISFQIEGTDSPQQENQKNPFSQFSKSPFQFFILNYLIACTIFSLKSFVPVKWIIAQLKQWFYEKSNRFLKKTQYELNKIYKKSKFRLQDSSLSSFNILLVSIPITFCFPILLIFPILLLHIQYFAYKPVYYCKSIQYQTSQKLALYIQRISLVSCLFFSTDLIQFFGVACFYFIVYTSEAFVIIYYRYNYQDKKISEQNLIDWLKSLKNIQIRQITNQQYYNAIDSHCKFFL